MSTIDKVYIRPITANGTGIWTDLHTTYGLYIVDKDIYKFPEKSIEVIEIPGHDGDYVVDNGYYKNVDVWYDFESLVSTPNNINAIANKLYSAGLVGRYIDIKDTYQPDYYRRGVMIGGLTMREDKKISAKMRMTFSCDPYRYYHSGNDITTITPTATQFTNPSPHTSYPGITIVANDEQEVILYIGSSAYNFEFTIGGTYRVDSDKKVVFNMITGDIKNDYLKSAEFPIMQTGTHGVSITGAVECAIMPMWRTL